eukprot:1879432-Prymnesium_polylepis.2
MVVESGTARTRRGRAVILGAYARLALARLAVRRMVKAQGDIRVRRLKRDRLRRNWLDRQQV